MLDARAPFGGRREAARRPESDRETSPFAHPRVRLPVQSGRPAGPAFPAGPPPNRPVRSSWPSTLLLRTPARAGPRRLAALHPHEKRINPDTASQELGARREASPMVCAAEGRQVFVAGQIGWNARQEIVGDDFVAQVEQALQQRGRRPCRGGRAARAPRSAHLVHHRQAGVPRALERSRAGLPSRHRPALSGDDAGRGEGTRRRRRQGRDRGDGGHSDFSLNRWILPVCVRGSSLTNLTERGYL